MGTDPFTHRIVLAATFTVAALALLPSVSDLWLRPGDSLSTLLWLAICLFALNYLAVAAFSLVWAVLWRRRRPGHQL